MHLCYPTSTNAWPGTLQNAPGLHGTSSRAWKPPASSVAAAPSSKRIIITKPGKNTRPRQNKRRRVPTRKFLFLPMEVDSENDLLSKTAAGELVESYVAHRLYPVQQNSSLNGSRF